ncbi:MAG: hypothetical protein D6681_15550 [Calditrichaeota bacterium]|nr:MAG: hypothetical protein D6681_15550 [Calditrichota bacterium]
MGILKKTTPANRRGNSLGCRRYCRGNIHQNGLLATRLATIGNRDQMIPIRLPIFLKVSST